MCLRQSLAVSSGHHYHVKVDKVLSIIYLEMFTFGSCLSLCETTLCLYTVRDAPSDIWGGGPRVFVACLLLFFWLSTSDIFFLCFVEEFFVVCFPYYVGYHLVFFLHKFRQQTFFSAHIFNKLFFQTFVVTNYFFFNF